MIEIPEHIKMLVRLNVLKELNDYCGRLFDKEEIRIFELESRDLCTLTIVNNEVKVNWTDSTLEIISFVEIFESMDDRAREIIIFNMDKFYEEI
jgi:hypothetical protein